MAVGNNAYIPENPLETFRKSSSSIQMTLISIIQGAVLSYLVVVVADNFRNFDIARWIIVITTFSTVVGTWQESIMFSHTTAGVFRYLDSLLFFSVGVGQFMIIRALVPDVAISYVFFCAAFFLLIGTVYWVNQYRNIQTHGPHHEVLDEIKTQIRSKIRYFIVPILGTTSAGLLLLFFHDSRLTIALCAINLIMHLLSVRQQAAGWNRILRYSNKSAAMNYLSEQQK
jgi:glycerol uptake facilitator-like aquaporin